MVAGAGKDAGQPPGIASKGIIIATPLTRRRLPSRIGPEKRPAGSVVIDTPIAQDFISFSTFSRKAVTLPGSFGRSRSGTVRIHWTVNMRPDPPIEQRYAAGSVSRCVQFRVVAHKCETPIYHSHIG